MEGYKHFSHPHTLSYHQRIEGAQLTCSGCKFPCTRTAVYSCRECKFFLHKQCFRATRSLIHPSHPDHPLSLFPSSTYTSGSFVCNSCNKTGSGFCFCCSLCEFDLHIHCAYIDLNPEPSPNPPPSQIKLKSHPNHPLKYKPPYTSDHSRSCDVCGTNCDRNEDLYHCDICDYDAHVGCTSLPKTLRRADHKHVLLLLDVNPYAAFECDVCRGQIAQNHCMYLCMSGCDYGMHVKCVYAKVSRKVPMDETTFKLDMSKLQNKMRELRQSNWAPVVVIVIVAVLLAVTIGTHGYYRNRCYRAYPGRYLDTYHCNN